MGPVGMPGISIPGPPGPKVCILGDIFFFYLDFLDFPTFCFVIIQASKGLFSLHLHLKYSNEIGIMNWETVIHLIVTFDLVLEEYLYFTFLLKFHMSKLNR